MPTESPYPLYTETETQALRELLEEFPEAVFALDTAMGILGRSAVVLYESNPALGQPLGPFANLNDRTRSSVAATMLYGESVERLICARLLLLTGHQSRAVGCCRDAWESLQWSYVVRELPAQASRWLNDKSVKIPRGFGLPAHVSNQLLQQSADIMNRRGTHPYYSATIYSLFPVVDAQSAEVRRAVQLMTRNSLNSVCLMAGLTIAYSLDQYQFLKDRIPAADSVIDMVERVSSRLVGLRVNLRDPLLEGKAPARGPN